MDVYELFRDVPLRSCKNTWFVRAENYSRFVKTISLFLLIADKENKRKKKEVDRLLWVDSDYRFSKK